MDLRQGLLYLHILAAIAWMGGGLMLVLLGIRGEQTGDELRVIYQMEWVGIRVGGPSTIIVIATGIWMVARIGAWSFDQFWILAAIALFVFLFLVGAGFHSPQYKRIRTAVEQSGEDSAEVRRLIRHSFLAARIEVVLLAFAVLLMVFKPGI